VPPLIRRTNSRQRISRAGAKRQFEGRPLTNRVIDLARQAKLIAPAEAQTPTDKRLQELWFRSPSKMDFEGVDTQGGEAASKAPISNVRAAALRPGDMYFDPTDGVVRVHRVSPVDPRSPKTIVVDTSKGTKRLPTGRAMSVARPTGLIAPAVAPAPQPPVLLQEPPIVQEPKIVTPEPSPQAPSYAELVAHRPRPAAKDPIDKLKEDPHVEPTGQSIPTENPVVPTDTERVSGEGRILPEVLPPQGVQRGQEERRTPGVGEPESIVRSEVRPESDRDRGIDRGGMGLGGQVTDIGTGGGVAVLERPLVAETFPEPAQILLPEPGPLVPTASLRKDPVLTTADDVGASMTAPERFEANLKALRIVKMLEAEDRIATPEEQQSLVRYSGFGDSAYNDAFSTWARDGAWKRRGDELRELITPTEYKALERSRLNAFYTTPEVVQATWKGLEQLGVDKISRPHVLEPSAGSGRFLGYQPASLAAKSTRTAIELDTMTGKLLKHTYPNTNVYVMGYQDTPLPDDSLDVAISNVPFGDYSVQDPAFRKGRSLQAKQIHNYFFAKTLDKLRPGGVLAFVTSHGTLDAP